MVDIFFKKFPKGISCKVICLFNQLYSLNYLDTIIKYKDSIDSILTVSHKSLNYLKKNLRKERIYILNNNFYDRIKGVPLGLSRILNIIHMQKFKELYITGVTFYSENSIKECYENNYMIEEGKKCNLFNYDKRNHHIPSNLLYTKTLCMNNKNITMCKELKELLYK